MAKKPIPAKSPSTRAASSSSSKALLEAELPYAIIERATNNSVLYPIDVIDGTKATLALPAGSTDVLFYWAIKDQAEPTFPTLPVQSGNVVDIPWQWVSTCIGHTVLIWYTAVVDGGFQSSLVLELEIQDVREDDLIVSRPAFMHAKLEWSTWWLNMFEFSGDETIRINAWPMIQAGQRLFVTVAGDQHQVPYSFIWVAYDHVVTQAEAHAEYVFEFRLSRFWMSRRQDYSALTIHLGVIWDGTEPVPTGPGDPHLENPLPINAQDFHLRTTTLLRVDPALELAPPHLRESTECTPGSWVLNPVNSPFGGHADVTYDGIAQGHQVCAYASGPGLAVQPLGCKDVQQSETSLAFDVAPWIIAALFNKSLTLSYSVTFSGNDSQYSPERVIKVLAPQLTTPDIEQATHGVVDLTTFPGNAIGLVPVWDYAAVGQCCWMWITGTQENGRAYRFDVLMDEPVTADWVRNGVATPISRSELQKLADCSDFELHFAASFDGKCNLATALQFPSRRFNLVHEPLDLRAPEVSEAVDNDLTIYNARNGVHVEVKYLGMQPDHRISLCWKSRDGTCWPVPVQSGSASGTVIFFLPAQAPIEAIGSTVQINYTVTSACKVQTSANRELNVSVPVRIPTPVVPQATPPATQGGILDLRTFTGDPDIKVERWWFIDDQHIGWLECTGTLEDGSVHTIKVMVAEPITAADVNNGLSRVLKREELETFQDHSPLQIVFKTATYANAPVSDAVVFPPLTLKLRKYYRDITSFDPAGNDWNGWQRGAGAVDPRDLVVKTGPGPFLTIVHFLFDWGFTNTSNPVTQREKLFKIFTDLEVGHSYTFSAWVRDNSGVGNKPVMVLVVGGQEVSPQVMPGTAWQLLQGTFTATSSTVRLSIDNLRMRQAPGNDFDVTLPSVIEK